MTAYPLRRRRPGRGPRSQSDGRLMYRVSEAAEMLGIGRTNVYELMNEGRVRSVRIGHRRLIPRVSLEAFVTELLEAS